MLSGKNIIEPLAHSPDGFLRAEGRYGRGTIKPHHPQIVNSVTMVGMIMGPEDPINLGYPASQKLLAQVGGRIDQQAAACIVLDHNRDPRSPVAGLVRVAFAPIIADPRNPGRSAAAEHDQLHAAALENKRKKLAVVAFSRAFVLVPRNSARKCAVSPT